MADANGKIPKGIQKSLATSTKPPEITLTMKVLEDTMAQLTKDLYSSSNNLGQLATALNKPSSNDGRSNWSETRFVDLREGDYIVLSPDFCGHADQGGGRWISYSSSWITDDGKDMPVWDGRLGKNKGKYHISNMTQTIDSNGMQVYVPSRIEILWDTKGKFVLEDSTGTRMYRKISDFGFVLQPLFAAGGQSAQVIGTGSVTITLPAATQVPAGTAITVNGSGQVSEGTPTETPVKKPTKPTFPTFDDVIVSSENKEQVLEAVDQINNYDLIFNKWGFGDKIDKGRAIALLFYGPPGTGKTMMGQAIANHFGYKLQVISTAEVQSSEPGGAERAIKAFFKAATDDKKTILLFDECDSLIYDRTNVGMILAAEINAVLTELEKFEGIVIFTTNRLQVLDEAFERRLALKLEFLMPTPKQRLKIWENMRPDRAPFAKDIPWETISEVDIAGGHIKNVLLKAARRAAHGDKLITAKIMRDCVIEEYESRNKYHKELEKNKVPRAIGPGYSSVTNGKTNSITKGY